MSQQREKGVVPGLRELDVVFTAPQLIDDLDLLSTPINYISYRVCPLDKKEHGDDYSSSGHLYLVRLLNMDVEQRNEVITFHPHPEAFLQL